MECENENEELAANVTTRRRRSCAAANPPPQPQKPRKTKQKPEVNVESIYLQENFKEPPSTPLETIYESPKLTKKRGLNDMEDEEDLFDERELNGLTLMTSRKIKRLCNFPNLYCPPKPKLKQRKDRARRMKQLTGVCIPKGSKISEEDVLAALSCLTESDENPENDQNLPNRSFSDLNSSISFAGTILRPDTSGIGMDYVIDNMSELSVGNEPREMLTEELVASLLPFDDDVKEEKVPKAKKNRRRSGRVSLDAPPPIPSKMDTCAPIEDEPETTTRDRKQRRRSGRVLPSEICELPEDLTIPDPIPDSVPFNDEKDTRDRRSESIVPCENIERLTSFEDTSSSISDTLPDLEENSPALEFSPQLFPVSETSKNITKISDPDMKMADVHADTIESIAEESESIEETNSGIQVDVRPQRRRAAVRNENIEDSSSLDNPRMQAKEKTRQRKPKDTSKIESKSQKLDMGLKRGSKTKEDKILLKRKKTKDEDEIPDTSDSLELVPNSEMTIGAESSLVMDDGDRKGTVCKPRPKTGSKGGGTGKRKPRSRRRISGISRLLYRKSSTEEEVIESSPEIFKNRQTDAQGAVFDTPPTAEESPLCRDSQNSAPDVFRFNSDSSPHLETSFAVFSNTNVFQQTSEITGTTSSSGDEEVLSSKNILPVTEGEAVISQTVDRNTVSEITAIGSYDICMMQTVDLCTTSNSSSCISSPSNNDPGSSNVSPTNSSLSSNLSKALTISTFVSTSSASSSHTVVSPSSCPPISPSTSMAALSLKDPNTSPITNPSVLPTSTTSNSNPNIFTNSPSILPTPPAPEMKRKSSRRRSARFNRDSIKLDVRKSGEGLYGSIWEGSPMCLDKSDAGGKPFVRVCTDSSTTIVKNIYSPQLSSNGTKKPSTEPKAIITEPSESVMEPTIILGATQPSTSFMEPSTSSTQPISSFADSVTSITVSTSVTNVTEPVPHVSVASCTVEQVSDIIEPPVSFRDCVSSIAEPVSTVSEPVFSIKKIGEHVEETSAAVKTTTKKSAPRRGKKTGENAGRKRKGVSTGKKGRAGTKTKTMQNVGDKLNELQPQSISKDNELKTLEADTEVKEIQAPNNFRDHNGLDTMEADEEKELEQSHISKDNVLKELQLPNGDDDGLNMKSDNVKNGLKPVDPNTELKELEQPSISEEDGELKTIMEVDTDMETKEGSIDYPEANSYSSDSNELVNQKQGNETGFDIFRNYISCNGILQGSVAETDASSFENLMKNNQNVCLFTKDGSLKQKNTV